MPEIIHAECAGFERQAGKARCIGNPGMGMGAGKGDEASRLDDNGNGKFGVEGFGQMRNGLIRTHRIAALCARAFEDFC